ncbi:MAG TPA: TonB-dependent receptor [Caulobacteraceae bacterium]|nr:TonB-dependent receptor [Caulobacteraceae bacterium]
MRRLGKTVRTRLLASVAAGVLGCSAGLAQAQDREPITIAPQPLESALYDFGGKTGLQVLFPPGLTVSKRTSGISGETDVQLAMSRLLQGTGLTYRRDGDMFVIVKVAPDPQSGSAAGGGAEVEALIVTAQKREEDIQDVPIAISAFTQEALEAQKIEGGFDLLKAIPNVTFSKNNFTSYNFSIRGVGTKAVSATTDPGVSVSFNNTGIIQNRLFEQEYFDIERVEVLRGPQGTLYGRNATSGVINVISAKPDLDEFSGWVKGEVGNYHSKRASAMVNIPLVEDKLAVRLAGAFTDRQGYDFNTITDNPVNGRDLWSARLTIGFQPTERLSGNLIWERFEEDDDRLRTGKQLCHRDPDKHVVGDTAVHVPDPDNPYSEFWGALRPALFSQGCRAGGLYDDGAFGTPNGLAIPFIFGAAALGNTDEFAVGRDSEGRNIGLLRLEDPYGGMMQSRDMREIASLRDPRYRARADLVELNVDFDLTDALTLSSQTAYVEDQVYSFQDFNRFNTQPVFRDTSQFNPTFTGDWSNLAPGGVFCDPQLGCSDTIVGFDISQASAKQFSHEFRLQSNFDGPINFSVGANYTKFDVLVDYYIMFNLITAIALTSPFNAPIDGVVDVNLCGFPDALGLIQFAGAGGPGGPVPSGTPGSACPYIDPNPVESINGEGHNYFRSKNPYHLRSSAAFGEVYWELADSVKVTAGLRYTRDKKTFTPIPSQILTAPGLFGAGTVARGYPELDPLVQRWGEWTGRLGIDWKPDLGFTDQTLLYAFYSHGYKGGGANPPKPGFANAEETLALASPEMLILINALGLEMPVLQLTADEYADTFEPEFVDAFEVGAKNTLLGGAMTLNVTAFYYDYKDYQVSQIRDRTAVNENFDATTWGLEFETVFAPSRNFQIIANLGYLDTEIADGETSIDIMSRNQGDPDYTVTKAWLQLPSNCVIPTVVAESWLATHPGIWYWDLCGGVGGMLGWIGGPPPDPNFDGAPYDVANYPELNGGAGLLADLGGNELPNAPHWTTNIGAQYGIDILDGWRATIRGDVYWQSQSWHRVYNSDPYDKLHGWYNANLAVWIERPEDGLRIELYAKNILDKSPITDAFLNSDDTGLTTNVFTLDPRLIGLSIKKEF